MKGSTISELRAAALRAQQAQLMRVIEDRHEAPKGAKR